MVKLSLRPFQKEKKCSNPFWLLASRVYPISQFISSIQTVAAVAEWYGYRIVVGFVTSSSSVPLKTRRLGQRCKLNLSRAETSCRWSGAVVRRGGASSGVDHVT
ncbi:uncharacterized protein TNCV_5032181 [Trichonephila clavipes]|nr:uncharacterized protein TNCV_5032181 [Trichonephila clavipes]